MLVEELLVQVFLMDACSDTRSDLRDTIIDSLNVISNDVEGLKWLLWLLWHLHVVLSVGVHRHIKGLHVESSLKGSPMLFFVEVGPHMAENKHSGSIIF